MTPRWLSWVAVAAILSAATPQSFSLSSPSPNADSSANLDSNVKANGRYRHGNNNRRFRQKRQQKWQHQHHNQQQNSPDTATTVAATTRNVVNLQSDPNTVSDADSVVGDEYSSSSGYSPFQAQFQFQSRSRLKLKSEDFHCVLGFSTGHVGTTSLSTKENYYDADHVHFDFERK